MDFKNLINKMRDVLDVADGVIDTGERIRHTKKRIESGVVAREKEISRKIIHKENSLWNFFTVLWIIMLTATIVAIKLL